MQLVANGYGALRGLVERHPLSTRWLLAGPGAVAAALAFLCAMPVWLPAGHAGVNNIAYPLILAPLIWAVAFTYACLEEDLTRGAAVILGSTLLQAGLVALDMAGA